MEVCAKSLFLYHYLKIVNIITINKINHNAIENYTFLKNMKKPIPVKTEIG